MAAIVQLDFKASRSSNSQPVQNSTAEIIIFPGVRIERWTQLHDVPAAQTKPKSQSRSRRKRAPADLCD